MSLTEKAREVIHDVKDIKEAQALITNQLENIRKENTHLYGDMSYVREKIGQQAIIVDKVNTCYMCHISHLSISAQMPAYEYDEHNPQQCPCIAYSM